MPTQVVREVSIDNPIRVFPRNGKWIALVGQNLCTGVFEVGDAPSDAIAKLEDSLVLLSDGVAACTGTPISADLP